MARLLGILIVVLAACGDDGGAQTGTSLEGAISCGTLMCSSGQVCRIYEGSGIDAGSGGTGPTYDCVSVPTSCPVVDCSGDCSACIDQLCTPTPARAVTGRELHCLVQ